MNVVLSDGRVLQVADEPLGRGASGSVHACSDGKHVVKLFHKPTDDLVGAMNGLLERYNATVDHADAKRNAYWASLFCWPLGLVTNPRFGILLPRYPAELRNLTSYFGPKNYNALDGSSKRWNMRVLMAWRLAQAVTRLHLTGLAHSDLSQNNVVADGQTGRIRLIDMDGLVVPGFRAADVLGTPSYIAPEVLEGGGKIMPSAETDKHALAVLIYQMLLYRHPLVGPYTYDMDPFDADAIEAKQLGRDGIYIDSPTDRRNRPSPKGFYSAAMLGPTLKGLFERALGDGLRDPAKRPRADHWRTALGRLADRIVTCSNPACDERYFPAHELGPISCPWCATSFVLPGGTPVLRLFDPNGKSAAPVTDFWIAGYPGRTLHDWHRVAGAEPDPFADQREIARVEHGRAGWALTNVRCSGFTEVDGNNATKTTVSEGRSIDLKEGMILRLGAEQRSRYLFVQWIK